jgi:hypothetical protein
LNIMSKDGNKKIDKSTKKHGRDKGSKKKVTRPAKKRLRRKELVVAQNAFEKEIGNDRISIVRNDATNNTDTLGNGVLVTQSGSGSEVEHQVHFEFNWNNKYRNDENNGSKEDV